MPDLRLDKGRWFGTVQVACPSCTAPNSAKDGEIIECHECSYTYRVVFYTIKVKND